MQTLILASKSPARRQILENLGFKVRVVDSCAPELTVCARGTAAMVKANALAKARAVARRVKRGIVIAADTVVVCGNRVIGKPRDRREAMKILTFLSGRPQDVYTGLAVIDVERSREYAAYAKTRVRMLKLSRQGIKKYIAQAPVECLAGSFDIQGKGALFIDSIDGCFYNVVGLPVALLSRFLKRCGIHLL